MQAFKSLKQFLKPKTRLIL